MQGCPQHRRSPQAVFKYLPQSSTEVAPDKCSNLIAHPVISLNSVQLAPFVQQQDELGREEPPNSTHLPKPAVLVLLVQNRDDIVLAEAQLVVVVSLKVHQSTGSEGPVPAELLEVFDVSLVRLKGVVRTHVEAGIPAEMLHDSCYVLPEVLQHFRLSDVLGFVTHASAISKPLPGKGDKLSLTNDSVELATLSSSMN